MYLAYLSYSTQAKNKLESDYEDYLKEIDRTLVDGDIVEWFKESVLHKYTELCEKHNRCKPILKDFSRFDTITEDAVLYGSNVVFKLLKVKKHK